MHTDIYFTITEHKPTAYKSHFAMEMGRAVKKKNIFNRLKFYKYDEHASTFCPRPKYCTDNFWLVVGSILSRL